MTSQRFNLSKRKFHRRNFSEAIELLIPDQYVQADLETSGLVVDPTLDVINSHINIARDILTILPLSAGNDFSSLSSFDGISPFFIKQNNFTNVTSEEFERHILNDLGYSFRSFESSSAFKELIETVVIPSIQTNNAQGVFSGASGIDELTYRLGWFYFLAGSSTYEYQPSSVVTDYFVDYLYRGKDLTLVDGINALTTFIWKNSDSLSDYIPKNFLPGSTTYTSGTQGLEKLKTYNHILYSRDHLNITDNKVRECFELYDQTGDYLNDTVSNGPFWRLVKAYSYAFADQQSEVNLIETLYDLEQCPDELLPELAKLIGWNLVGYDPKKWRLQLANAVSVYRAAGTKRSISTAVNSVFTPGVVDVSGNIQELWESYIPFLIMYSLASESIHFRDYSTWTPQKATQLGVNGFDFIYFEINIKLAVDRILNILFEEFPDHFILAGKPFPVDSSSFVFEYRYAQHPIPPFEEIPYYVNCNISRPFLLRLADLLVCFGVPEEFALKVRDYIDSNTISTVDEAYQDYSENNGWLFFTLTHQEPPNWDKIIIDPRNQKENYLSLWSGKSSHYKLNFEAANFDFSKDTFEVDSRLAIVTANRLADIFSPAKAVKNSSVILRDTDFYSAEEVINPHISLDRGNEISGELSSVVLSNPELAAMDLLGGLSEFSGGRFTYSSIVNTELSSASTIATLRNSYRRRGLHNKLNMAGFYDRTGFNQPAFNEMFIDRDRGGVRYTLNSYDYYNNPYLSLNPLKGFAPDYDLPNSTKALLPRTIERVYLPMASAYDGGGATSNFDFTKIEEILNDVSGRNCQALLKFYVDHPNYIDLDTKTVINSDDAVVSSIRYFGLPTFLNNAVSKESYLVPLTPGGPEYGISGLETGLNNYRPAVSGISIDYSNSIFLSACSSLIMELGNVYDDDPRIAHIEVGFLGHEGNWSNAFAFDHSIDPFRLPRKAPVEAINLLVETFDTAFSGIKVSGRYLDTLANYPENTTKALPIAPTLLTKNSTNVGLNDSNLTTYTLGQTAGYSLTQQAFYNVRNTYETKMRTAEIDPVETRFWNVFRTRGSSLTYQDLGESITNFRPSIISFNDGYKELDRIRTIPRYANPILYQRQLESTVTMGYNFYIENSYLPEIAYVDDFFYISIILNNNAVAPFYYNWPVIISFTDGTDILNIQTSWDLRTAKPGQTIFPLFVNGASLKSTFPTSKNLTVLLSVQRPANFIQPIQFANAEQILGTPYVSLGSFLYIADPFDYETSGANPFPLGFVPSSLAFASVEADCSGTNQIVPPVYDRCAFTSSATYYGYDVSSTLKPRGYVGLPTGKGDLSLLENEFYVDREQLDPFMRVLHKIETGRLYKKYEKFVDDNIDIYAPTLRHFDVVDSLVNQEINCSGLFLSSLEAYENAPLGRKIHKLFNLYTSAFNRHPTPYDPIRDSGQKIYSHAFGSILENGDFEDRGSIATLYDLYTENARQPKILNLNSSYFSGSPGALAFYDTDTASDPSSIIASSTVLQTTKELVNSSIIHGVDIVHTSGVSEHNHFVIYDLQQQENDTFIYNNSFLRLKSINGLPRIRFRIKGSDFSDAPDTFRVDNFLCPEHDFKFTINALAAKEDGTEFTDATLGVWIHTELENSDQTWHFGVDGQWHLIKTSELTIPKILYELTHKRTFERVQRGGPNRPPLVCLDPDTVFPSQRFLSGIGTFKEQDFHKLDFTFNTRNYCSIKTPEEYYKHKEKVHRYDQHYVIEVFMLPEQQNIDRFILIEDFNLRDETIYDMTRIDATGTPTGHKKFPLCEIYHVNLDKEDIRAILNYYNSVAGKGRFEGKLGRDQYESSGLNLTSGGSRSAYRVNPLNATTLKDAQTGHFNLVDFVD